MTNAPTVNSAAALPLSIRSRSGLLSPLNTSPTQNSGITKGRKSAPPRSPDRQSERLNQGTQGKDHDQRQTDPVPDAHAAKYASYSRVTLALRAGSQLPLLPLTESRLRAAASAICPGHHNAGQQYEGTKGDDRSSRAGRGDHGEPEDGYHCADDEDRSR
jgi:hypothetical protein